MEYGIQLYSVRDITEKDLEGALRSVSEIGYRSVEFAGFFGHSSAEVAAMLKRCWLKTSGTHTGWQALVDDFDGTVAYHQRIGTDTIIVPGTDLWSRKTMDAFVDVANKLQPKLAKAGMKFGFHNHYKEFETMPGGYVPYDEIVSRTSLELELDTYWAYVAGKDPVELMERYRDRLRFIHIKDGDASGHGTPLGMGTAPVAAVYRKARELGVPMIVESETLDPDGLTEAKICFDYLKQLEVD